MSIHIRPAALEDVAFLADVVITATVAQGRFPADADIDEYRAGYEEWTRETVLGAIPDCDLSVIEYERQPIGRLRVVRAPTGITLAGLQLLPAFQNQLIGTNLIGELKAEAEQKRQPLFISVEKDNPRAQRLYERMGCTVTGEDEQEYHLAYYPDAEN